MNYPKRLIEVDLPIARISAHARREKSIRHGHISTLHIWWARRPLAACRAVILASLWPDPVDLTEWLRLAEKGGQTGPMGPEIRAPLNESLRPGEGVVIRPNRFLDEARAQMKRWSRIGVNEGKHASGETIDHLLEIQSKPDRLSDPEFLRAVLLDFIADFADWDNSTDADYLATSRALVQAAHEAIGGEPDTHPLILDPFAGGGSIPLESLRVGADSAASDLNPVALILNQLIASRGVDTEMIDRFVTAANEVGRFAAMRVATEYPSGMEDGIPFATFWARTVRCEGPNCGIEIPLIRGLHLSNRSGARLGIASSDDASLDLECSPFDSCVMRPRVCVVMKDRGSHKTTAKGGGAECPSCGYTMKQRQLAAQTLDRGFGHRLIAVGVWSGGRKDYRSPTIDEERKYAGTGDSSHSRLARRLDVPINSKRPSPAARGMSAITRYGYSRNFDLFTNRQLRLIEVLCDEAARYCRESGKTDAHLLSLLLAVAIDRIACFTNTFCRWAAKGEHPVPPFGKNGFPMVWDYVEANPFAGASGSWTGAIDWIRRVLVHFAESRFGDGLVQQVPAQTQWLPSDSVHLLCTDPPYYDSYPYADLADFFYPLLSFSLAHMGTTSSWFGDSLSPKDDELVLQPTREIAGQVKDHSYYESGMQSALAIARETVRPDGIAVVVFANKTTQGWEALLSAICQAGWIATGSWPLQTERESRSRGEARLQSSVHLVCRPRELASGALQDDSVGEWREVLSLLPKRLSDWMRRLASEGVVGADAIFACLGPALEIFSRYSRVEKASGEAVTLREYLEQVWAAVSNEALSMIFKDADAAGLEPDARLTAIWLWTIGGSNPEDRADDEDTDDEDDDGGSTKQIRVTGFVLEFDAARKIAQGLGIHLERSESIVEVKGDTARLLPVAERIRHLFGKEATQESAAPGRKKKQPQRGLFEELEAIEAQAESGGNGRFGGLDAAKPGTTVLDKVHQSMVLFASGRGEALRRFLVDDGVGKDARFWKLAQALSALYPSGTDEKRWVDGVLARKKGLGL